MTTPASNRAAEYREWSQAGTAKVVILTEVHEHERGSEIVTEARVSSTAGRARILFRGLWAVVGPFGRYVGLRGACRGCAARRGRLALRHR